MYNYSMKQEKSERKSERKSTPIRTLFQLLALLSTCSALYFLYQAQLLPIRLFGFLTIGVFLLLALLITLSKRFCFIVIFLILDTIINLALSFVFYKYNDYFSQFGTHANYHEKYSLVTLADSELAKTGTGEITYLGLLKSDPYLKTVEQYLQNDQSTRPGLLARTLSASDLVHYENLLTLTTSLINKASVNSGNLKTMLIGESYLESLKENNQEIYAKLHVLQDIELAVTPKTVEVTKNDSLDSPFTVYISGIDNRDHTLPFAARSDVNLIMVFNPKKHKILILNTPRDFYVPLAMNGKLDKLTHAGLYGVNESIHTLENFYGIKFNYYARINFDATSSVIDQLGGVDVTIPYVVNTYHGRRHYEPGTYHLNGDQALDFARERVSISWAGGDRERGRNQEKILSAMLHTLQTSPNDLNRIDQIFASIAKNIQTNFTSDDLKYLVQRQLTTLASWQTELIDVDGKADITSTFTYPEPKHFVWHPYQDSVDRAKAKLQEYLQN